MSAEDDDGDGDVDDDDDDDDEDDEDGPPKSKRAAEMRTPQSAKRAKVVGGTPSRDEPKTPGSEEEYANEIVAFLEKNGPQDMSAIGLAIKRPPSVPKLGQFVTKSKLFKRVGQELALV